VARPTVPTVVTDYLAASQAHDLPALDALRAGGYEMVWPQSGERFDRDGVARMQAGYPGGGPTIEDRGIDGGGNCWVGQALATYPDGKESWVVNVMQIDGARIVRETRFYADAFEAPPGRAQFTTASTQAADPTAR
jgi:hypothetical protein